MSRKAEQIVGDKLRNALMIVWLASKYDKNLSVSELRRMSGYDSSGLYSAMESGWFKQETEKIVLTDKAVVYLYENLIQTHSLIKTILVYIAIFPLLNLFDWYLITSFNINLFYNPLASIASIILLLLLAFNWYRVVWWTLRRKSDN